VTSGAVKDWHPVVYGATVITGADQRRAPSADERRRILRAQGDNCLYCQLPIGSEVLRKGRPVRLRRNWDHFVPYAYVARNPGANFVLACHVCNAIKNCRIFATVDEARQTILPLREEKGYEAAWSARRRANLAAKAARAGRPPRQPIEVGQVWASRTVKDQGRTIRVVAVGLNCVRYVVLTPAAKAKRNTTGRFGVMATEAWRPLYDLVGAEAGKNAPRGEQHPRDGE